MPRRPAPGRAPTPGPAPPDGPASAPAAGPRPAPSSSTTIIGRLSAVLVRDHQTHYARHCKTSQVVLPVTPVLRWRCGAADLGPRQRDEARADAAPGGAVLREHLGGRHGRGSAQAIRSRARGGSREAGSRARAPTSIWPRCGRSGRASGPCSSRTAGGRRRARPNWAPYARSPTASDLRVAVGDDGSVDVQPAGRSRRRWSALLLIIRDAQRDGSWERLKACRNPDCRWAYYDRSHAGAGRLVRHGGVRQPDQEPEPALAPVGGRHALAHELTGRAPCGRRRAVGDRDAGQRTSAAAPRPSGARIQPQRTAATTTSER